MLLGKTASYLSSFIAYWITVGVSLNSEYPASSNDVGIVRYVSKLHQLLGTISFEAFNLLLYCSILLRCLRGSYSFIVRVRNRDIRSLDT
jgi:hypothetical protein